MDCPSRGGALAPARGGVPARGFRSVGTGGSSKRPPGLPLQTSGEPGALQGIQGGGPCYFSLAYRVASVAICRTVLPSATGMDRNSSMDSTGEVTSV